MKQRQLPKHICAHPDGLLVRVHRGELRYQAFVPKGHADPLARAIELRDNFLKQLPTEIRVVRPKPRSNTGISGISETVAWHHSKPHNAFSVSWFRGNKGHVKRIYFKNWCDRAAALERAIKLREEKLSEVCNHVWDMPNARGEVRCRYCGAIKLQEAAHV